MTLMPWYWSQLPRTDEIDPVIDLLAKEAAGYLGGLDERPVRHPDVGDKATFADVVARWARLPVVAVREIIDSKKERIAVSEANNSLMSFCLPCSFL